jgi:hypothetical protein
MGLDLFIPTMGNVGKSAKDYIVSILLKEPSLKIRQIQNRIKKQYAYSVTYQAVRKAVLHLESQGVVLKERNGYSLNEKWIYELDNFCGMLKSGARNKALNAIANIQESRIDNDFYNIIEFQNIKERTKFIVDFEKKILDRIRPKVACASISHPSKLHNIESMIMRMNMFNNNGIKFYILYGFDTPFDKIAASCYRSLGANVKTGIIFSSQAWFNVYGDIVVQTVVPKSLLEEEKRIYNVESASHLDISKLIKKIYLKKAKIKLVIQKNKALAGKLRRDIISYFKR